MSASPPSSPLPAASAAAVAGGVARVEAGSFLTLHYRLSGPRGAVFVDTFAGPPATLSLGTGELAPAMEARLLGLAEGSEASFELAPGEAFGARSGELLQRVRRAAVEAQGDADRDYAVGDVVRFPAPGNDEASIAGIVREADADSIVFDFNHPLAGEPVTFAVRLVGVL